MVMGEGATALGHAEQGDKVAKGPWAITTVNNPDISQKALLTVIADPIATFDSQRQDDSKERLNGLNKNECGGQADTILNQRETSVEGVGGRRSTGEKKLEQEGQPLQRPKIYHLAG